MLKPFPFNGMLSLAASQPVSAWKKIFPDRAVTVVAIDCIVLNAIILEMNGDSYSWRLAAERRSIWTDAAVTNSDDNLKAETTDNIMEDKTTAPI